MAKIEFSPAFAAGTANRIANLSGTTVPGPSGASLIGGWDYWENYSLKSLMIFKGTKLTRAEMEASRNMATAGTPLKLAMTNDLLIKFSNTSSIDNTNDFSPSVVGTNTLEIITKYRPVTASGTASWFLYFSKSYNDYTSSTLGNFIIGDVGTPGSGADLIIADTNIVAGELNRVTGWKLSFPYSWEY